MGTLEKAVSLYIMFYKKIHCEICNKDKICRNKEKFSFQRQTFFEQHRDCQAMKYIYRIRIKREVSVI